eukprot:SAG31_NODE_41275_length_277_cov_0.567416_1_plen_61_part_01
MTLASDNKQCHVRRTSDSRHGAKSGPFSALAVDSRPAALVAAVQGRRSVHLAMLHCSLILL